jgi:hypothetical protein
MKADREADRVENNLVGKDIEGMDNKGRYVTGEKSDKGEARHEVEMVSGGVQAHAEDDFMSPGTFWGRQHQATQISTTTRQHLPH